MPLDYTRELASYWATITTGDASRQNSTAGLNSRPASTVSTSTSSIAAAHTKDALPLIISHGWPGSVAEFHKIIDALADPTAHGGKAQDAFHVVAPSLPGYGFSGKPTSPGTSVEKIGAMWGQLMARLGYGRYVAQGGDWGSIITQSMGQTETGHCAGIHINMPIVAPDPDTMDELSAREQSALEGMSFLQ